MLFKATFQVNKILTIKFTICYNKKRKEKKKASKGIQRKEFCNGKKEWKSKSWPELPVETCSHKEMELQLYGDFDSH